MLQAFALKEKLKKMGYDVKILDYRNDNVEQDTKIINFWLKNASVIENLKNIMSNLVFFPKNYLRKRSFEKFRKRYLDLTSSITSQEIIKQKFSIPDIFICGSDQIWNEVITKGLDDIYTLNFETSAKKISYAASVGNNKLLENNKEEYKNKLKNIDFVSVREKETEILLERILGKNIKTVLDPVFLLTIEEWNSYLEKNKKSKKDYHYILAYYLQKNDLYINLLNNVSKKTNMKIINFERRKKEKNVRKNYYTANPLQFVELIKNSQVVVTSSFHAIVFSIIFHREFYVVPHTLTGSRVINLLKELELDDRIILSKDDLNNIKCDKNIEWEKIDKKIELLRKESIDWLKHSIEN